MAENILLNVQVTGGESLGFFRSLAQSAQTSKEQLFALGQAGSSALNSVTSAAQQLAVAQAKAATSQQQQLQALQGQIGVQRQIITGTIALADATQKLAEEEHFAASGSRELAAELAKTRAEYARNASAIQQMEQASKQGGAATLAFGEKVKGAATSFLGLGAAASVVGVLTTALGALGAALSVQKIVQYADAWTNLTGRLRLVTSSAKELADTQEKLFTLAQTTRTDLTQTVDLYTKLARTTKDLGISQTELLRVTETVNKAVQLSGGSAESANAALVQLGQGLASGTLRGEELNFVLEQTPRLAEAIARGMGVTIGQLRKLGEEGKITGQAVISALKNQAGAVDAEFAKLPITIGAAFTVLGNSVLKLIGTLDQATGASRAIVTAIVAVANAADVASAAIAKLADVEDKRNTQTRAAASTVVPATVSAQQANPATFTQNVSDAFKQLDQSFSPRQINEGLDGIYKQLAADATAAKNLGLVAVQAFKLLADGTNLAILPLQATVARLTEGDAATKAYGATTQSVLAASKKDWETLKQAIAGVFGVVNDLSQVRIVPTVDVSGIVKAQQEMEKLQKAASDRYRALIQQAEVQQAENFKLSVTLATLQQAKTEGVSPAEAATRVAEELAKLADKSGTATRQQKELENQIKATTEGIQFQADVIGRAGQVADQRLAQITTQAQLQAAVAQAAASQAQSEQRTLETTLQSRRAANASLEEQGKLIDQIAVKSRAQVAAENQAREIELTAARQKIAVLTDELRTLQSQLGKAPAGQDPSAFNAKLVGDIAKVTDAIGNERAAIVKLNADTAASSQAVAQIEQKRQQAIGQATADYIKQENLKTERTKQEAERRAQLEIQALKSVSSTLAGQKEIGQSQVALLQAQGAPLGEIIAKKKELIAIDTQIAQTAVLVAQAQVRQHEQNIQNLQVEIKGHQALLAAAKAANNTIGANDLQKNIDALNEKIGKEEAAAQAANTEFERSRQHLEAIGNEGAASVAQLNNQLEVTGALLTKNEAIDFGKQLISGILGGTQKLSQVVPDFFRALAVKAGSQFLFGKEQSLDKGLIGNFNALVGGPQGGILGGIFTSGASNIASSFGESLLQGLSSIFGTGGAISNLFSQSGSSIFGQFSGSLSNGLSAFLPNIPHHLPNAIWQFPTNVGSGGTGIGGLGSSSGLFGNVVSGGSSTAASGGIFGNVVGGGSSTAPAAGGGLGAGLAAGALGNFAGEFLNNLFGVGKSKQGQLGGTLGSAAFGGIGFLIAGPLGAAIGSALGKILGGIIGDLFKPGRIQIEKDNIEKFFQDVFKGTNFKVLKESDVAAGLKGFEDLKAGALALGAVYAKTLGDKATEGTVTRFAGQFLGNLEKMGAGSDEAKKKLGELAKALGADLGTAIDAINGLTTQFSKNQKNNLLSIQEFSENLSEARRNLAKYGDTSQLTAKQLTELALANGNTGSTLVTYGDLITGAIQLNTEFKNSAIIAAGVNGMLADKFLSVAAAQGTLNDATKSLGEQIKSGNLSLEEAVIQFNKIEVAAGKAALELKDFTLDPEKLKQFADFLKSLTFDPENFTKSLGDALSQGLTSNLDASLYGAAFDDFFNSLIKDNIIKAIVSGFTQGLALDTLKPLFDNVTSLLVEVGTGKLPLEDFGPKLQEALAGAAGEINKVKDAFEAAGQAGKALVDQFTTASGDFGFASGLAQSLKEGLTNGLDPTKYAAAFDTFFNGLLRQKIIDAIIGGFTVGLSTEALKPLFDTVGALLAEVSTGKLTLADFGTQLDAALAGANGEISKIRDAFAAAGEAGKKIVDQFADATGGDFSGIKSGLISALQDGLTQGLDPSKYANRFTDVLKNVLRNAVIQSVVEGFTKSLTLTALKPFFDQFSQLLKGVAENTLPLGDFAASLKALLQANQPEFAKLKEALAAAGQAGADLLNTLGLMPDTVDQTLQKIDELKNKLDAIAQEKINVQINLQESLASIGVAGAGEKALALRQKSLADQLAKINSDPIINGTFTVKNEADFAKANAQLETAIKTVDTLSQTVLSNFQKQQSLINDTYNTQAAAIQKAGALEQQSIKDSYDAQKSAVQARIDGLNSEKDKIQEAYQARSEALSAEIEAVQEQLQVAQEFAQLGARIRDQIVRLTGSGASPLAAPGQLANLQREAARLREQLSAAPDSQRADLTSRLSDVLQQELSTSAFQRGSTAYRDQFNAIVRELESLRDDSLEKGKNAESLQQQLVTLQAESKELQKEQTEALKSIDLQIKQQQELAQQLATEEQAALKAQAAQQQAAIDAARANADRQIEAAREEAEKQLTELAAIKQGLLDKQEALVKDQLTIQERIAQNTFDTAANTERIANGIEALPASIGAASPTEAAGSTRVGGSAAGGGGGATAGVNANGGYTAGGYVYAGGSGKSPWNPNTQPGQKWVNGKWQFVNSGADVTLDAATNTSYWHGQALTPEQVRLLIKYGPSGLDGTTTKKPGLTPPFAGPIHAANGYDGTVYSPTMFMAGEGGRPERVNIGPSSSGGTDKREVKIVLEVKATVEVTGADSATDAGQKTAKAIREATQQALNEFVRGDYFDKVVRDKATDQARYVVQR